MQSIELSQDIFVYVLSPIFHWCLSPAAMGRLAWPSCTRPPSICPGCTEEHCIAKTEDVRIAVPLALALLDHRR